MALEEVTAKANSVRVEEIMTMLKEDPAVVAEVFPNIKMAPDRALPGTEERPLVLIPRAEAWADS